jgi:hypothetical protein
MTYPPHRGMHAHNLDTLLDTSFFFRHQNGDDSRHKRNKTQGEQHRPQATERGRFEIVSPGAVRICGHRRVQLHAGIWDAILKKPVLHKRLGRVESCASHTNEEYADSRHTVQTQWQTTEMWWAK